MKLNYDKPKRTPLNDLIDGYNKLDNVKEEKPSDSMEELQKRYEADPNSLNPTQQIMLGMYELQEQRNKKEKEREKLADQYMNEYEEANRLQKEENYRQSEKYKELSHNLTKLQTELSILSGNGEVVNEE